MAIRIFFNDLRRFKKLKQHDVKMAELTTNIKNIENDIQSTNKSSKKSKYEKQLILEKQKLSDYLDSVQIHNNPDDSDLSVFHTSKEVFE